MMKRKKTKRHYFHLFIRLSGQITKSHKYPKSIGTSANARAEAGKGRHRSERADVALYGNTCGRVCTNILDFDEKNKLICHYIRPFTVSVSMEE